MRFSLISGCPGLFCIIETYYAPESSDKHWPGLLGVKKTSGMEKHLHRALAPPLYLLEKIQRVY